MIGDTLGLIVTGFVAARFWWFLDHRTSICTMKNDYTKFQLLKLSKKSWMLFILLRTVECNTIVSPLVILLGLQRLGDDKSIELLALCWHIGQIIQIQTSPNPESQKLHAYATQCSNWDSPFHNATPLESVGHFDAKATRWGWLCVWLARSVTYCTARCSKVKEGEWWLFSINMNWTYRYSKFLFQHIWPMEDIHRPPPPPQGRKWPMVASWHQYYGRLNSLPGLYFPIKVIVACSIG